MKGLVLDNGFSSFDKQKLIHFVELYQYEFFLVDLLTLDNQLDSYILDMFSSNEFAKLIGIAGFAVELIKTKRDIVYPLDYLFIKNSTYFTCCNSNHGEDRFNNEDC